MKRIIVAPIVFLMLLGAQAMADDPKPADKPAVTEPAKPAEEAKSDDPVADANKIIDDATKDIDKDPGASISLLVELAKSGRWGPFAGLLILVLVWAFRKFLLKSISANWLPWLTLGLAVLASGAVGLIAGNVWWQILIDTFITGGAATLLWSAVFKHFMKPKEA